jgi:pyruvate kinase
MTKIVCTLGPAVEDLETMKQMIRSGMDVARINFSHGTHESNKVLLDLLRKAGKELGREIPAILDTKGPEIRLGTFKNGPVSLKTGDSFILTADDVAGDAKKVSVSYKDLIHDLKKGSRVLIDDGLVELTCEKVEGKDIICRVLNDGVVSDRKGVNLPEANLSLPSMTEQDVADVLFGIQNNFDFIAMSFVRSASDVYKLRRLLDKNGGEGIHIIAKIENRQGINNIKEIVHVADGIMVARGDMGVEIPIEEVPLVQRNIITTCYKGGKPVITATQMLDSMIRNPRPTRAEVNDVSQAIIENSSAIMLSGETASGKYPIESIQMMDRIAIAAEQSVDYWQQFVDWRFDTPMSVTNAISHATCATAMNLNTTVIITVTMTGTTARMISRFRPGCPIIALTPSPQVYRQLSLSWGVIPVLSEEVSSTDDLFSLGVKKAMEAGQVSQGDLVVITAGVPVGCSGTTNIIKVQIVGNVLLRGTGIGKELVSGELCVAKNTADANQNFTDGAILVMHDTSNEVIQLIRKAKALIVESSDPDCHAVTVGQALEIPVLFGAAEATTALISGTAVILDTINGLVLQPQGI